MTTYAAQLQITARTAWGTWYDASTLACQYTATAWGWYHRAFFSDRATARYQWAGQMLGCMMALVYLYVKRWADAQVEGAIFDEIVVEVPCSFYTKGEKYWSYGEDCYVQAVRLLVSRSFQWKEDWELMEAIEECDNKVMVIAG